MNRNDEQDQKPQAIPPAPVPNVQRPEREDDDLDPALKTELEARRLEDEQSDAAREDWELALSGQDALKTPEKPTIPRPRRTRS